MTDPRARERNDREPDRPSRPEPLASAAGAELSEDDLDAVVGGLSRVWTEPLPGAPRNA